MDGQIKVDNNNNNDLKNHYFTCMSDFNELTEEEIIELEKETIQNDLRWILKSIIPPLWSRFENQIKTCFNLLRYPTTISSTKAGESEIFSFQSPDGNLYGGFSMHRQALKDIDIVAKLPRWNKTVPIQIKAFSPIELSQIQCTQSFLSMAVELKTAQSILSTISPNTTRSNSNSNTTNLMMSNNSSFNILQKESLANTIQILRQVLILLGQAHDELSNSAFVSSQNLFTSAIDSKHLSPPPPPDIITHFLISKSSLLICLFAIQPLSNKKSKHQENFSETKNVTLGSVHKHNNELVRVVDLIEYPISLPGLVEFSRQILETKDTCSKLHDLLNEHSNFEA